MAHVHLITGGSRSGKSRHALDTAGRLPGSRTFVATCPRVDDEMEQRIEAHVAERESGGWHTIEEQTDLSGALTRATTDIVLIDCLTLWVSNLLLMAGDDGLSERQMADHCDQLLDTCRRHAGRVLLVTNEVGLGIVPDNELARRFRDLAGRCNQVVAAGADRVTLMVSGLPWTLKDR